MQVGFIGARHHGRPHGGPICRRPATSSSSMICARTPLRRISRPAPIWADTPRAVAEPMRGDLHLAAGAARRREGGARARRTARRHRSPARPGSTSPPMRQSLVKKLHAAFAEKGAHMLDAPVSGGPQGAASRKLAIWVGGEKAAFDQHKAGARRDRRPGALHRPDRLGHRRQARAQHVGLRHRLRAGRDLRHGREGRRRAAGAVGGGAPGRGRPPLHVRRVDRPVAAGQIRSGGRSRSSSRTRTSGSRPRSAASSACRCASASWPMPR